MTYLFESGQLLLAQAKGAPTRIATVKNASLDVAHEWSPSVAMAKATVTLKGSVSKRTPGVRLPRDAALIFRSRARGGTVTVAFEAPCVMPSTPIAVRRSFSAELFPDSKGNVITMRNISPKRRKKKRAARRKVAA